MLYTNETPLKLFLEMVTQIVKAIREHSPLVGRITVRLVYSLTRMELTNFICI